MDTSITKQPEESGIWQYQFATKAASPALQSEGPTDLLVYTQSQKGGFYKQMSFRITS